MTIRATLSFISMQGCDYLYDDVTGSILPWNNIREELLTSICSDNLEPTLQRLSTDNEPDNVQAEYVILKRFIDNYGAFFRSDDETIPQPNEYDLSASIPNMAKTLILVLTENCNMRCTYCSLSEVYPLNRTQSFRKMTLETAKKSIDWYVDLVSEQIKSNPRKKFGLSFYGGDPLMNMPVFKGALEYVNEKYPDIFSPVATTNGTLLTPTHVKTLVEHNVRLSVSIDGPKKEHDRNRIDIKGQGTFNNIFANLEYVKKNYPDYWKNMMGTVSVYEWNTDLVEVESFFEQHADSIPKVTFVSAVGGHNTDWYSKYSDEQKNYHIEKLTQLHQKYFDLKLTGKPISSYLNVIVGMNYIMTGMRPRQEDKRPAILPYSGTCMPGDKLAVGVDGKLDICERVNGSNPMGDINVSGIDYSKVTNTIEKYQKNVLSTCKYCSITKRCGLCFQLSETDGDFKKIRMQCDNQREAVRQSMMHYVSMKEIDPTIKFDFESDTSRYAG